MSGVASRRGVLLAGAAMALAGCATTPALTLAGDDRYPELEPLISVTPGCDALTVRVRSQGCASKADFVFRVDRDRSRAVVAFARRRLETCRGPKGEAALKFSYAELGLSRRDRIIIANPIASKS